MSGATAKSTQSETALSATPRDYITRAIDLRNSIHLNSQDRDFAFKQFGEIRYLFDTNILLFFLDPFKEYGRVAPFEVFDREASQETAQALAVVTAEYLFSRQLYGQGGSAPMLSPWHADEFEKVVRALTENTPEPGTKGARRLASVVDFNLRGKIADLVGCSSDLGRLRAAIDVSTRTLGGAGEILMERAFVGQQFGRMMRNNMIRPLRSDETIMRLRADGRMEEDAERDAQITDEIAERLRVHRTYQRADLPFRHDNNLADIRTVVELLRLNREVKRRPSSKPVRYVLVTTDRALHNAMLDWWSGAGQVEIDFFPIRRVLQFAPFINVNQMPNGIANDSLYGDVRAALDAFLAACGVNHARLPRALPAWSAPATREEGGAFFEPLRHVAQQMADHLRDDPEAHGTLTELIELWQRLSRESVFLNAGLLSRRLESFGPLADFLRKSRDVTGAVREFMADTVASVERGHLKFSVQHHLASEIEEARNRSREGNVRRGMMVLRESLPGLNDSEPLAVFLDRVVHDGDVMRAGQMITMIDQRQSSISGVFFLCACVAFWAARWESALYFADRAMLSLQSEKEDDAEAAWSGEPSGAFRTEVAYVQAVARRYIAMNCKQSPDAWSQALMETAPDLQDLIDQAIVAEDYFAICRLELELGLAHLTSGYALALGHENADAARARIEVGVDHIESAVKMLGVDGLQELSGVSRRYLFAELIVGLAGGSVYAGLIDAKPWQGTPRKWGPLAAHARRLMDEARDIIPEIYTLAPDLLELANERDPDTFAVKRQSILAVMNRMQQAAGGDRTALDREAMALLSRSIMRNGPLPEPRS